MFKTKYISLLILTLIILSFATINISALANVPSQSLESFVNDLKQVENDYYLVGKTVITNSDSKEKNSQLKKEINFYISKIQGIQSSLANYASTVKENSVEARNIALLQFAADFYRRGLSELLIMLDTEDDTEYYNALEFYYYAKILAQQSVDFVEDQLSTTKK